MIAGYPNPPNIRAKSPERPYPGKAKGLFTEKGIPIPGQETPLTKLESYYPR